MPLLNDPLLPIVLGRQRGDKLLRCLSDTDARFIVVGGCALAARGKRAFGDVSGLDLLLEPSATNARAVLAALLAVGVPASGWDQALERPGQALCLSDAGLRASLLTPDRELHFDEAYEEASRCKQFGVEIRIASVATLIHLARQSVQALSALLSEHERDLLALQGMPFSVPPSLPPTTSQ